ncbi:hypothetical protein [Rudanella lutea]|nr:hypothetical protein [Rudanella lutea]
MHVQQHDTPTELIDKIEALDRERQADLQALKALLTQTTGANQKLES